MLPAVFAAPVGPVGPMPITYDIARDRQLVTAMLSGVPTEAEIFNDQREVWSQPEIRGYRELIDMTAVTDNKSVTPDRIIALAELSGRSDPPSSASIAIIASSDFHFGPGRMYQTYRESAGKGTKTARVFRNCREALTWLNTGTGQG
jgi:hypothetical protein